MPAILFTCPTTGMAANAWRADNDGGPDTFAPVACPACGKLHLMTIDGKIMGRSVVRPTGYSETASPPNTNAKASASSDSEKHHRTK